MKGGRMKRYKSKPVEVEALYFKEDGSNRDEVKEFMDSAIKSDHCFDYFKILAEDNNPLNELKGKKD